MIPIKSEHLLICAVMSALCLFCSHCLHTAAPGSDLEVIKLMLEVGVMR